MLQWWNGDDSGRMHVAEVGELEGCDGAGRTDMTETRRRSVVAKRGDEGAIGEPQRLRVGRVQAQHDPGDGDSVLRVYGGRRWH